MRYIGSKRLLLRDIEKVISTHSDGSEQTFLESILKKNIRLLAMICFTSVMSMPKQ